jgi:hypothetical protein
MFVMVATQKIIRSMLWSDSVCHKHVLLGAGESNGKVVPVPNLSS